MKFLSAIRDSIVIFCICLFIFALGEIAARSYAACCMEGTSFFREDRFVSPWFVTYEAPAPRLDSKGRSYFHHRPAPVPKQKPNGAVRIIAVGGSTTRNARAFRSAGIDYAQELERFLWARFPNIDFEVLNAGGDAFSSAHSLVNIQFRLIDYRPDIILLMHNINDLSVSYFGDANSDYANKYLLPHYVNPTLQAGLSFDGFLHQSRLLTGSGLFRFLEKNRLQITSQIDDGAAYFRRNLIHIHQIARSNGSEVVFLSQPNAMKFENPVEDENFRRFNDIVRNVSLSVDAPFVDMFANMGQDPDLFLSDNLHYTPEGVRKFARMLGEELARLFDTGRIEAIAGNRGDSSG